MAQCTNRTLGATATRQVDLRLALASEVLDSHVMNGSQILDLILCFEQLGTSRIKPGNLVESLLVAGTILAEGNNRVFLISAISLELEASMVAVFSSKKQEAGSKNVNAGPRSNGVKELDLHSMNVLFRKV